MGGSIGFSRRTLVVASGGSRGGNWALWEWGITVATVALAYGADIVVPDKEDSGRPPLVHWGYPMWAPKRQMQQPHKENSFFPMIS